MLRVEFFQRATAGQIWSIPNAPKSDAGFPQSIKIQRVPAFRGRNLRHASEVLVEQLDYL
jgi:hypothetical protein